MFLGQHSQSIDSKGRVVIPAKFRPQLAGGAFVTRGLDNCLYLFARGEWEVLAEKLASLPLTDPNARAFQRFMLSGAEEAAPDKQGRINLPEALRGYASIETNAIIAGVGNRIEIHSDKHWDRFITGIVEDSSALAENFRDLGI